MKNKEERIAKIIARAGICSRRDAEKLIAQGRVTYKGEIIDSPAMKFESEKDILIDGKKIEIKKSKLWLYHKPVGLVVSHYDENERNIVFDHLPIKERVISVGRLDKNTSGLLLLTNDGELARELELPKNNYQRVYLVRVYGMIDFARMRNRLKNSIEIDGIVYKPIDVELQKSLGLNHWLRITITEGKNREIRNIINYFDLRISRLMRIEYGPFQLGDLKEGEVAEIDQRYI